MHPFQCLPLNLSLLDNVSNLSQMEPLGLLASSLLLRFFRWQEPACFSGVVERNCGFCGQPDEILLVQLVRQ